MFNYDKLMQAGGSAFPTEWQAPDGRIARCVGMTLRDYFAGQAILNLSSSSTGLVGTAQRNGTTVAKVIAQYGYEIADAMIAERVK